MNGICKSCGLEKPIENHHIDYNTNEMVPLCKQCHINAHNDKTNPFHPKNNNRESNKKTIPYNFRIPPILLEELQTTSPDKSVSSLIVNSIKFYIKYNRMINNKEIEKEIQFNKLFNEYIILVNKIIEIKSR